MSQDIKSAMWRPLSAAQRGRWFSYRLEGNHQGMHNNAFAARMHGPLDSERLAAAVGCLMQRHAMLRACFRDLDGAPQQRIADAAQVPLLLVEAAGLDETALRARVQADSRAPFALADAPLFRVNVYRTDVQAGQSQPGSVLLLAFDHLICDGWSYWHLLEELGALLAAPVEAMATVGSETGTGYLDYVEWQQEWLAGAEAEQQRDYWRRRLGAETPALRLPRDRPAVPGMAYRGGVATLAFGADDTAALREFARVHQTGSLFGVLLAAYQILLHRHSGQEQVVVGAPMPGRVEQAWDDVVGDFVNPIALKADFSGDPDIKSFVRSVRDTTLNGMAHQEYPFANLVEDLMPAREPGRHPLFQTAFVFQKARRGASLLDLWDNAGERRVQWGGLELSHYAAHQSGGNSNFELVLEVIELNGGLRCDFKFDTEISDLSSVRRMAGHFQAILRAMVADAGQRVSAVPLLDEAERHRLQVEFNDSAADYPQDALIHDVFEAQAARQPDAVALTHAGRSQSYAALNRSANQIAHYLLSRGVRPDDRVAICIERGPGLVAGLLGILKAGCAYVPLDPTHPAERLAYMLDDSTPLLLLTQADLRDQFAALPVPLLAWDDAADAALLAQQPTHNPDARAGGLRASHLAQVIYTSGSTGAPKGVMITHRNVLRLVINNAYCRLHADDCVVQCANPAFDATTWEIWGALLVGARLLVVPQAVLLDGRAFGQLMVEGKATALLLTVGLFNEYVDVLGDAFAGLTYLLVGGDALDPRTVARLLNSGKRPHHLVNAYGPTECTTVATAYEIATVADGARTIPIGRPIANTQVHILDRHLQPVPLGVAGEIYIGGAGVARGYLNRDELTAQRFIDDRFSDAAGARLYRSGDLGRWLADGTIEFLGRNDFQVKIRGFRIELGEIEARLAACAGVRDAVVIAREDTPGDKRLVAYVIAQQGAALSAAQLRRQLAQHLAHYMLPGAFVMLDSYPLTSTGKLDRKALPLPDAAAMALGDYAAPQGAHETLLAGIWQDLLGLQRVGRHDHFFELGGHSLLAIQLVARLRQAAGVEIALRELFARPTLADMADLVGQAARSAQTAIEPIAIVDRSLPLPLSSAQQRLWFIDQLDHAASLAYHIPAGIRLRGRLDQAALQAALDRIVARHEILRTCFAQGDGGPLQAIAAADAGFVLAQHDLGVLIGHEQTFAVRQHGLDEASQPFDLARGPLIRGQLLRLSDEEHILLVTQHHIISDGWSTGVFLHELQALYGAFHQHRDDPLPALSVQYADYAAWQRHQLQDDATARQVAFWKQNLHGAPAALALPVDHPRPAQQSYAGGAVELTLAPELAGALRALSQRHGATLFMTLLTAWATLMARLSGEDDVVIGTPTANRAHPALETLIGFFVNTLALRVKLDDDPSVAHLLAQVKTSTLDAYAHQDLPFEQVVEAVNPHRSLGRSPLFQTMLAMNNAPALEELSLPGLALSPVAQPHIAAHFELVLSLEDHGQEIKGTLEYASDLFEESSVRRMAGHFQAILRAMVADAGQRVSALPLLGEAERHRLQVEFNDSAAEYPRDALIHELFEARAARRPDAVALTCAGRGQSYAALNRSANQIAHYLLSRGVRPDDRVAICIERGPGLVAGLLGILKAGCAYVPLDPTHPAERLAYMLDDSTPLLLLTQADLRDQFAALPVPLLAWDDAADAALLAQQPTHNPDARAQGLRATHLAQVIYTSGSTGAPKGVMITHRNVLRLVINNAYCRLHADDCVVQCANPAFDATTWEIWGALLVGARLLVVPQAVLLDGRAFGQLMVEGKATALLLTVGLFNEYVDVLGDAFAGLTYLLVGGDALDPRTVARLLNSGKRPHHLVNAYGPTECTTVATAYEIATVADGARTIPIGSPIANTRIHILDRHLRPVPLGVAGEIYIGGAGVARGYLNRAELTAQRFIDDHFSDEAGARLYRTGDLGRWLADGTIEFLGRNDFQVKIRGFRIEPGEIEARLAACDGVREAVVIAREDTPGDKRLVAYVIAQQGATLSAAALRRQLAQHLAHYMLPGAFVMLDSYPLTSTGKLDRKALPLPDAGAMALGDYAAPQGEHETLLAAIWQDLLRLERVGRHDNFFELGGHSLLAIQLVARLRQAAGVEIALRDLFADATLAGFAAAVAKARQADLAPIPLADRGLPLPLSWSQQRLWFLDQLDPAADAAYHLSAGMRLTGQLDAGALRAALNRVVERHEILRTRFVRIDGEPRQMIDAHAAFTLRMDDLGTLTGADQEACVAHAAHEEETHPFDLERGPLIRGRLLRLSGHEHILFVTQHHIISDGWSVGILIKEVGQLYSAFSGGQADPLAPPPLQYADYAVWQRDCLQGETLARLSDFWRGQLAGAPTALELPTDHARPMRQSYRGASVPLRLPAALADDLRGLSQRHGCTLFMTLMAGWAVLLARMSGQSDVVIGTPAANRQRSELEGVIGFFANTLALRVQLEGDPSVAQLLAQMKQRTLGAYENQDLPFEQIVEIVKPQRSMSHSPIFQAMLAMNNTPGAGTLSLPGLDITPLAQQRGATQFELVLSLTDNGGEIAGSLSYASALFEPATIARLAASLLTILGNMVADAQQAVSRLGMLDAAARQQLLVDFNDTGADWPRELVLHQLFEAQAQQRPHALALVHREQRVNYRDLNRHANRIAHYLLARGVRPGDCVALCVERGIGMVAALLGILKAGAAYVPLDPSYPALRLSHMLTDSAPSMMISQRGLLDAFAALQVPTLALDDDAAALAAQPEHNPDPAVLGLTPHHLAYVIYTSGSTGLPKGVMIEHGSVVNFLAAMTDVLAPQADDTLLAVTTLSFDIAALELFLPLARGARIVLADSVDAADGERLTALIEQHGVTLLQATPATWRLLLAMGWQGAPGLTALCGGEAMAADLRASLAPRVRALWNLYGPTEATIWATTGLVARSGAGRTIESIGRPMANTQVHILDAHGQLVPVGVAGEIHIGGAGVARGYRNLAELTGQRFIADPFSDVPHARLYRTGDLGRWLPDGSIDFIGRSDFQVKLRGFRIELGEIEARLAACEGVREAVAVVREDSAGDKRLVAYLLAKEGVELAVAELRKQVALSLADYMVPNAFVVLDAFPLTANGKLDRKSLPAPDMLAVRTRQYEAPQGAVEECVAQIWQELLGLEKVGRNDQFFDLGGHSLLAILFVSRLRQAIGIELSLRDLFTEATVAGVAARVEGGARSAAQLVTRADRALPLPLSWAQQRLWFIDQLDHAASVAYHMPFRLRLRGRLDQRALAAALDRIVARHENLRTRFVSANGAPAQVIDREQAGFALSTHDLRGLTQQQQASAVLELSTGESRQLFDLAAGPLIRGRLVQLSAHEHVLLVTQHHIISDAWSIRLLVAELQTLYAAFADGKPDPLPPLVLQYADYAVWQREWLRGPVLTRQLDYWKGQLRHAPALLELPTDRARPMQRSHRGAAVAFRLPDELAQALQGLGQRHGTTLFMTLLAAWAALLSRVSGQNDIVVGTPVANRGRGEIEALTGFFVNTLALRVRLDDDPSVAQLLAQVRASTLDAYTHQDLPFEQVVEALQPARSMGHSPIFQVMLAMNNTPGSAALELPGLSLDLMPHVDAPAQFDLSLSLTDADGVIEGELTYATDLFDRQRIEQLAHQFKVLLAAMAMDARQPVSHLPLLDDADRRQLLVEFNPPASAYARDKLIHELFEQQAARHPQATAVAFEGHSLSYAELNLASNRLARHLRQRGVGRASLVALFTERGPDMIVAILAVLKAGGAYVPLDPDYPAERIQMMLDDAAPALILTQSALTASLPAHAAEVVAIDGDRRAIAAHDGANLAASETGVTPADLAYVIYTSGSTGKPKGVMIEHANVVRLFAATDADFGFGAQDTWTLFHSYAFDFSVWEIWGALLHGGKLVVVPYLVSRSPAQFHALLAQQQVTVLNQTPSAFQQLSDVDVRQAALTPLALRYVIFGGEALNREALAPWLARRGDAQPALINMYGITETTVHVTYMRVLAGEATSDSVGKPIADLQAYILDARLQPQPVGVTGELYVAGGGLARGYLNRPELTAQRFIDHPFSAVPGARLYKSGDLARYTQDGNIEYLGRNDHQVKIRGFRIELGEIEAQLSACAGVREAVVIAREDQPGDKRLVAYLLAHEGAAPTVAALRGQLSRNLAHYMVPSAFVTLPVFPLTVNGKLDRRALPAPDASSVAAGVYEAPQGPLETAIADIWQDLLGLENVGRHDHFFELGGHSLLVISLIERLRQRGLHTDVRSVFSNATVAGLAALMPDTPLTTPALDVPSNRIPSGSTAITPDMLTLVTLRQPEIDGIAASVPGGAANIQDIYPLGPLQTGIFFHHLKESEGDAYLLRMVASFDNATRLEAFLGALQSVIDRHDILRSAVLWDGLPQPVQVVCRGAALPVERLAPADAASALPQLLAATDPRQRRLDIRRAPLMSAHVATDAASGTCHLALLSHHLVCDHITMELIKAEIAAVMLGRHDSLPAPQPYRNFIAHTLRMDLGRQEAYFRQQLGDIDEPTAPFGLLDVQGNGEHVAEAGIALDDALARRIRDAARQHGVTPAVLFHVAWARLLAQCCGRDDVVFGTVLSGRMQGSAGADQVLGMFISTLPVRVALGQCSVQQAVAQTYARLTELLVHEQASLSLAQRCSGVPSALPLFTSLLNFRHSQEADAAGQHDLRQALHGIRFVSAQERTNYPVALMVDDLGQGFNLTAQCDGVDPVRINAMLTEAVDGLADALMHQPRRMVSELNVLPADERQRLLMAFNPAGSDYAQDRLVHELFQQQAARNPAATAVVSEQRTLSYAGLNAQANRLARHLRRQGVGPDARVAICMERGIDMIVAMLATLKAGGAYVPIDPACPAERMAQMLGDSAPAAILVHAATTRLLAGRHGACALTDIDADAHSWSGQPDDNLELRDTGLTPRHLAYVMYTSGSTGVPKGVMIEHRSINRLVINNTYAPIGEDDCVAHCANTAFDASTWEIWSALLNGARLLVVSQEVVLDAARFDRALTAGGATALWLTVGLFNAYVDTMAASLGQLRYLLVGGDVLNPQTVARLLARAHRPAHLINGYGPTETTTFASTHAIVSVDDVSRSIPIGRPIANTRMYVLDARRQPAPAGVAGELYIGGAGVARGYLNRPELTAERFVADPYGSEADARLYRTGDLGRWMADGTIEYLGRNDSQVKLRGFRIELGEIEAQLAACAGVREAIVIAREDQPGDKRLVAYLLAQDGMQPKAADLREQLARQLAHYMVPVAFVTLAAFPLTANGKLDRRALPAPDTASVAAGVYEAPLGDTETAIAAIWQELLLLERVGRHDHFLDVGGHSLLALQLQARIRGDFGLLIDLGTLFQNPTVAALAEAVSSTLLARFDAAEVERAAARLDALSEEELLAMLAQERQLTPV